MAQHDVASIAKKASDLTRVVTVVDMEVGIVFAPRAGGATYLTASSLLLQQGIVFLLGQAILFLNCRPAQTFLVVSFPY